MEYDSVHAQHMAWSQKFCKSEIWFTPVCKIESC